MAKVIEGGLQNFAERKRRNSYPWDEWCDGQARICTRGVDFDCTQSAFRNAVYAAATSRGLRARCKMIDETQVVICFTKD